MHQLVRLQLNESSTASIQAQVVISGIDGGGSAIGYLPPIDCVIDPYQQWRSRYLSLETLTRVIRPASTGEHSGISGQYVSSPKACKQAASNFLHSFNSWLRSSDFVEVREVIAAAFNNSAETLFVICTDSSQLQQLPWVLWDFLSLYPDIEVAVSAQTYRARPRELTFPMQDSAVQVLAILGDSTDIDIQADQQFLSELPNAKVTFLAAPQKPQLHTHLWDRPTDILFFAGHSDSQGETGTLYINEREALSLEDIRHALSRIARQGLTLAIFNSCDGLGLAKYLSQAIEPTSIPYIIVMREAVPDAVAQTFLKHFLESFSRGTAFHTAVRTARERLENSANTLPPYGEWMPIIWQNPLAEPPRWPQPEQQPEQQPALPMAAHSVPLKRGLLTSLGVAVGVSALRFLGVIQGIELAAYDHLLRSQPADPIDQTILIVGITEPELDTNELASISDETLQTLLNRLYQGGASIVGLDLVRDHKISSEYAQLISYFSDSDRLITACGTRASGEDNSELEPSPQANPEGIGLAEFVRDKDITARRHLLAMDRSVGKCQAEFTFSTLLAYQYLLTRSPDVVNTIGTANYWRWGAQHIPLLRLHQGGYHREDMRGDTTLLNYRIAADSTQHPFQIVTLTDILSGKVSDEIIKDRIVLVGTNARSIDYKVKTPLRTNQGAQVEIPGVVLHAHQISQLVDAVKGQRPLLRFLPVWADSGWIFLWAGIGSTTAGIMLALTEKTRSHPVTYRLLANTGTTSALYVLCWTGFVWLGLWLPLIPAALSLTSATGLYYIVAVRSSAPIQRS